MHTAPEIHPVPVKSPWNHIGIDFVGPLVKSKSENQYIINRAFINNLLLAVNFP